MGRTDSVPRTRRVRSFRISLPRQDHGRYVRWARKGTLAVLDQGLFSGSNFVVSVLLARWMSESDYGAYSVAYSIFLLVSGFYNVLLLEPMTIFGPVRHRAHFPAYFGQLTRLHGAGAVGAALVLVAVAGIARIVASESAVVNAFLGLGLAHGLMLFFWLTRRACYVEQRTDKALSGTLVYSVITIAGAACLYTADLLTPLSVFVAIGVAGVIAGIVQARILFRVHRAPASADPLPIGMVARENWDYGRWMIIASIAQWFSTWAYFVLAGGMLSLEDVAGLKAIQNLILPMTQVFTAFILLFTPWAAQRFAQRGIKALERAIWGYTVLEVGIWLIYFLVMLLVQDPVFDILYGDKFAESRWMLPYFMLLPLAVALTTGWKYGLRIIEQTWTIMIIHLISACTTLTAGLYLIGSSGLKGAVFGILLSNLIAIPALIVFWRHIKSKVLPRSQRGPYEAYG